MWYIIGGPQKYFQWRQYGRAIYIMGGPYLVDQVYDLCIDHCTIAQALKKFEIKDLANIMTSALIFPKRV